MRTTSELFSLFPNPGDKLVQLKINASSSDNYRIELFDLSGKRLKDIETNSRWISMNLSSFSSGVYLIKVSNGYEHEVQRLVKK